MKLFSFSFLTFFFLIFEWNSVTQKLKLKKYKKKLGWLDGYRGQFIYKKIMKFFQKSELIKKQTIIISFESSKPCYVYKNIRAFKFIF